MRNVASGPGIRVTAYALLLSAGCFAASDVVYTSPSCGPEGGSAPWACGPWPTSAAPELGRAGTITTDPDTGNRVLRVTEPGSFGEARPSAFKMFDGGWRAAWNADSTRFLVVPWNQRGTDSNAYWVAFDAANMKATGHGALPNDFSDLQWDQFDPDLIVGLASGAAESYNIRTKKFKRIFEPSKLRWRAMPWLSAWGGNTVCIAEGPQDKGFRLACHDRESGESKLINLREQTIGAQPLKVTFRGNPVALPATVSIHTITVAPDGNWLAVDTHGNSVCTVPGLGNYSTTQLFIHLASGAAYEWNIACGATHWAYGYDGVMLQSASPKWTPEAADGPCNSDGRGIGRRVTGPDIDSTYSVLTPCLFFAQPTWSMEIHLSWMNNRPGEQVNRYPVLVSAVSPARSGMLLGNEIAAMETTAGPRQGRLWRFAQTWNDPPRSQCRFLEYASPAISPDGRWALFPSNWRGQTGEDGACPNGTRTDVFLFELK